MNVCKKIGIGFVACMTLFGCQTKQSIAEDEIVLQVQLDLQEDIGLFIVDYDMDGDSGSSGISNANKSLLKHDERVDLYISKDAFDTVSTLNSMTLQFSLITQYFEPNYDNIYPEEYRIRLTPIQIEAEFGKSYSFSIHEDSTNGYTVVYETNEENLTVRE